MSSATRYLHNPASGEPLAAVREDDPAALPSLVRKARAAGRRWAALSCAQRGGVLRRAGHFIVAQADRIADTVSACTGKTRIDALTTEVIPGAVAASYYAREAARVLRPRRLRGGSLLFANKVPVLHRLPFGVVGIITPWNYPFGIPVQEVFMALATGNSVLLKVSTQVQPVGLLVAEMMEAAGLAAGLFTLVELPGVAAGRALVDSGIDKLFFTGSVAVGKKLMKLASERLLPLALELGGNDAMIVLDDADVERAAAGALWAGLSNSGQSCAAVERVYVEERAYPAFMQALGRRVRSLRQGPDRDYEVDLGSLANSGQLETVRRHLEDALARGARIAAQSGPLPDPHRVPAAASGGSAGLFFPAVVLENVSDEMLVMREETFGPLLAVARVRNAAEAVARANASRLGLSASVWTRSPQRARRTAARLEAGSVLVNDHLMNHGMPHTPWGGFKQSGNGGRRTHGRLGLEEMTQPKVVMRDRLSWMPRNMWWYPHRAEVYRGLKAVLELVAARPPRLGRLPAVLRLLLRGLRRDG